MLINFATDLKSAKLLKGKPKKMGLHYLDYIVFILFLSFSLFIGLYHAFRGGRQKTTEEFFMGGRSLHTIPVAISITLSFISAILVLGQPAEVYTRGTQFSVVTLGQLASIIFSIIFIVPIFYKLKVTSSFEYLELRYNSKKVKLTGSIVMLLFSTIQLGIVLYAPSVALEAVTGVPTWVSIILSSIIAIIYTTLGGMKAVVWTDVFQGGCVVIGMMAVVIQGLIKVGGPTAVWDKNYVSGRIEFFNMDPNPFVRTTFWSAFINGIFVGFVAFGVGQTTVQRYCALPSLSKARWSQVINIVLVMVIVFLATAGGMVIYAYYDITGCDPIRGKLISSPNQLLPYFVLDVLNYPGFVGLFTSALYGGALSTMSSSLNSAAAVTWQDVLIKYFKHFDDSKKAFVTKGLVVIYGAATIAMAFLAKYIGPHVLQAVSVVTGVLSAPLFGIFILGMFFSFANSKGAVVGCIGGIVITSWIAIGSILTNQHNITLPTTIESCPRNSSSISLHSQSFVNTTQYIDTTSITIDGCTLCPELDRNLLHELYSLSYLLFPMVGFLITIFVGILVSICTGGLKDRCNVDPELMASYDFFNKSFSCSDGNLNEKKFPLELIEFKRDNAIGNPELIPPVEDTKIFVTIDRN